MDLAGDNDNLVVTVCDPSASNYTAHSVTWEGIDLSPRPLSWCSEFALRFGSTNTYNLVLRPAVSEENAAPCDNDYSSTADLIDLALTFEIAEDGCIKYEFYETFDDYANARDGDWLGGSLTVTACNMSVLPVEWLSFTAEENGTSNLLTWQTATETNTEKFQVQKQDLSTGNWENLSEVSAVGNSQIIQTYQWLDQNPGFESVYRIASVDFDGSMDFSPIKVVNKKRSGLIITNENPFSDFIHIEIFNDRPEELLNISLHDLSSGKLIYTSQFSANQKLIKLDIPSKELASGMYVLNVWNKYENYTSKLVKTN
jgi:hypothetical protein